MTCKCIVLLFFLLTNIFRVYPQVGRTVLGRNCGKRMHILLLGSRVDSVVLLNSMGHERTNRANAPNGLCCWNLFSVMFRRHVCQKSVASARRLAVSGCISGSIAATYPTHKYLYRLMCSDTPNLTKLKVKAYLESSETRWTQQFVSCPMLGGSLSPQHGASSGCGWKNSLQIWRLTANILNKQSRTDNKGWPSSLGVGRGVNNPSP
jgi:hypothetical protein